LRRHTLTAPLSYQISHAVIWSLFGWRCLFDPASVYVRASYGVGCHPDPPKVTRRRSAVVLRKFCGNLIEPYPLPPRRLSGHQVLENRRSGYADEEDHE
jgi:hypothetical protein